MIVKALKEEIKKFKKLKLVLSSPPLEMTLV